MSASRTPNNFDGLRLLAALTVLWSHQFLLMGRAEPLIPKMRSPGHLAVLVFFSLSGYLVSASWARDPHVGRFLLRRFLRIWPAYAVVVVICGTFAVFNARDELARLASWFYFSNLFFHGFESDFFTSTPRHELNGSLWTIPYEVKCYVGLAAVGMFSGRRLRWLLLASLAALLVWFGLEGGQRSLEAALLHWQTFPHLPYFGAFFLAGALLFHFEARAAHIVWFVIGAGLAMAFDQFELSTLLLIPPLCVWIGRRSWPIFRKAGRGGDFSFGIYLWAWPVAQIGVMAFGRGVPVFGLLSSTVLAAFAIAWLSWNLVEERALRWKPHFRKAIPGGGVPLPSAEATAGSSVGDISEEISAGLRAEGDVAKPL
jgi:peptidoglycan/LPS O-acetylase OafA/YrhL